MFSFDSLVNSISLGGIDFYGNESWTKRVSVGEKNVDLVYEQGMASQTNAGKYVAFRNSHHYSFNRADKEIVVTTELASIQQGPADWSQQAKIERGSCEEMSGTSFWLLFVAAILNE